MGAIRTPTLCCSLKTSQSNQGQVLSLTDLPYRRKV